MQKRKHHLGVLIICSPRFVSESPISELPPSPPLHPLHIPTISATWAHPYFPGEGWRDAGRHSVFLLQGPAVPPGSFECLSSWRSEVRWAGMTVPLQMLRSFNLWLGITHPAKSQSDLHNTFSDNLAEPKGYLNGAAETWFGRPRRGLFNKQLLIYWLLWEGGPTLTSCSVPCRLAGWTPLISASPLPQAPRCCPLLLKSSE